MLDKYNEVNVFLLNLCNHLNLDYVLVEVLDSSIW